MRSDNKLPRKSVPLTRKLQTGENKNRKWKYFFIALTVINILWLIPISLQPIEGVVIFFGLGNIKDFFTEVLLALGIVSILFFPLAVVPRFKG
jgi:hypothetical protein